METINMAIVTNDEEFGKVFGLALVNVYKTFTVTLFNSDQLHRGLPGKFDLVLTDSLVSDEGDVQLVERPSMAVKDSDKKLFRLYRYNNIRVMAGELLFVYSCLTGRNAMPIKNEDLKLITFAAAEGGVGCTSAAISFAQQLKRFHNKKVFYLSLEEIESTLVYMEAFPDGKNIGEYLYYLFNQTEENTQPFLESYLVYDYFGVDSFTPSIGRNLINALSPEEMQHFITSLINADQYDYIIVDAGNNLRKNAICCFDMAHKIYLIENSARGIYKGNRMIEYLVFLKGESILDRIEKIEVRSKANRENEDEDGEMIEQARTLPVDPSSFTIENGIRNISPDGKYGLGIKQLVDSTLVHTPV